MRCLNIHNEAETLVTWVRTHDAEPLSQSVMRRIILFQLSKSKCKVRSHFRNFKMRTAWHPSLAKSLRMLKTELLLEGSINLGQSLHFKQQPLFYKKLTIHSARPMRFCKHVAVQLKLGSRHSSFSVTTRLGLPDRLTGLHI